MNWVDEVVEQHKEFESPLSFWKWAALAAISAVVKDNIWAVRGGLYNLYPNIYVMLHADSGLKKGPPVALASKLVKPLKVTKVIEGRSSIQGILKDLGGASYTEPGGKIVTPNSTAFICSSELSSSIVEDKVATTILTDLYDRHYRVGDWRSLLKMETFDLKNPTITMLTATNEAHSDDFFTQKDITGGYFARTFIIHESKKNRTNSLQLAPKYPPDHKKLGEYLKCLSTLKGPFAPTASREQSDIFSIPLKDEEGKEIGYYTEAGYHYEIWYREFSKQIEEIRDPTGTLNRFGDSVFKVAMLFSLAKSTNLILDTESVQDAITTCEKLVGNIRKVTVGKTGGNDATNAVRKTILIQELMGRDGHSISKAQLLKKYWIQGNAKEWEECIDSFFQAGFVHLTPIGENLIIRMTDVSVEEMKRFLAGKVG